MLIFLSTDYHPYRSIQVPTGGMVNDIIRKQMRLRQDHLSFSLACQSWSSGHSFCPRGRSRRKQPDNPTGYASTSTSSSTRGYCLLQIGKTKTTYYFVVLKISSPYGLLPTLRNGRTGRDGKNKYYNLERSATCGWKDLVTSATKVCS